MKQKLLIAQDDDSCRILKEYFATNYDYEVVGTTSNGDEVIDLIIGTQPDILILDLILPTRDGFYILDYIQTKLVTRKPKVLVLTALTQESFVSKSMSCGASDFLAKPFDSETLRRHLADLQNSYEVLPIGKNKGREIEERISSIFLTVGIPAHIKGYQFLREAIKLSISHPEIINSITKELYPAIAEKFETSPSKVERAIRHAIEVAWNRGKIENINNIFGIKVYDNNEKPTNSEFIALISDKMIIDSRG